MVKPIISWVDKFELVLNIPLIVLLQKVLDKFGLSAFTLPQSIHLPHVILE